MASSVQQQSFQRKLIYILVIVVLFTASWAFRRYAVEARASEMALREENQGDVELAGSAVRLTLTGSRGFAVCVLWITAQEEQKKNRWNELELITKSITKLQPHFIRPWEFQSWNLSYNVSVAADRVSDKYYYIARGIQLLADGERQNRNNPNLRLDMGIYYQSKIAHHDAKEKLKALFQLSCIDPAELRRLDDRLTAWEAMRPEWRIRARRLREAERLKGQPDAVKKAREELVEVDGPRKEFRDEFRLFCGVHPQFVRRLRERVADIENSAKKHETPEDVVRFVRQNREIPTLFDETRLPVGEGSGQTPLKEVADRFPVLPPDISPPPPQKRFPDPEGLNEHSKLEDHFDPYAAGRAWFCYAMQPAPDPSDDIPGKHGGIKDRIVQRVPKGMWYVIFRNFPARAQTYIGERYEEDGWFDELWNVAEAFPEKDVPSGFRNDNDLPQEVGQKDWPEKAFGIAYEMWERHGKECHLLISPQEASEREAHAHEYEKISKDYLGPDATMDDRKITNEEHKRWYHDYQFWYNYQSARQTTNFLHFLAQSRVEREKAAIIGHKHLYQAEEPRLIADYPERLRRYELGLGMWRDLLAANHDLRSDHLAQEDLYAYELKYLMVFQQMPHNGQALKKAQVVQDLAGMLAARPDAGAERLLTVGQFQNLTQVPPPFLSGPLDRMYYKLTDVDLAMLRQTDEVFSKLDALGDREFDVRAEFLAEVARLLPADERERRQAAVLERAEKPYIPDGSRNIVAQRFPGLARRAGRPFETMAAPPNIPGMPTQGPPGGPNDGRPRPLPPPSAPTGQP